jgi:hypothetical protein
VSKYLLLVLIGVLLLTVACGGSGSGSTAGSSNNTNGGCAGTTPASAASNVAPITVDGGLQNNYADAAFATVTVCVPGSTTNCQTIDHLLVDTGSEGLRVLASGVAGGKLSPSLLASGSNSVVECAGFLSFATWGPVELADVHISGEIARNVPIQVIGDPSFPDTDVPASAACLSGNSADTFLADTVSVLGSNGILGVGPFPDDCGTGCEAAPTSSNNPGLYYTCSSGNCAVTALSSETQNVQNPVSSFSQDNNGSIVELPAISAAGAAIVNGSLVFGIGTQSNNALNGATVLGVSPTEGDFSTIYKGVTYPESFIDSGSNSLSFLTTTITGIPLCTGSTGASDFYCPTATESLSATNEGVSGSTKVTAFSVANANELNGNFNAFSDLAGPLSLPKTSSVATAFDWGLPFFFGCNVFTSIEGKTAPSGTTPYFAY